MTAGIMCFIGALHYPYYFRRRVRRNFFFAHSRASGNPDWVPAFAGTSGLSHSPPSKNRGRVERRGLNNPAASCGGVGKIHTIVFTARCRFPGAPRAVFEGLLRAAPGGCTFEASFLTESAPVHRSRAQTALGASDRTSRHHQWSPVTRGSSAPGQRGLDLPLRGCASEHPATATASRPAPEDADQTPLVSRDGM